MLGPLLLLRSDGNQSRQMSLTAGANGLSDRADQPGTSSCSLALVQPRPREIKRGAATGGPDLLAQAVPLSPPQEASRGVGVCSTRPGQF